ncbi:precorrin-2 C20-methyltransferase [Shimia isoporae]|uniref:Precorrin-2 C20-methyltransferase n=1 Tax=Shimia isoporae TaxID=647720 RepID=A0A4R1NTP5_9RHOB|nr:precorrin-2 C(20)-methyltransferase [Shimia isoporae]TCL10193.1 precorrin-2 C20-methyltransferase [Shimia isoporae]
MSTTGTIHGVGLGPGDPDLMSVRAHRLLKSAKHVAFFRKAGRKGQARQIVEGILPDTVIEFPMEYPVTTEIPLSDPRYNQALSTFYEEVTQHLIGLAKSGDDVVVLCEGDPFFYGSFMHLYARLRDVVPVEVVPAITGMSGAWTATETPITWGDDVLTVLMATLDETKLTHHIAETDALVVMKIGTNFEKVVRALKAAGRFDDAWIVQYATMPKQNVIKLSEMTEDVTPYFSIIVVHGQGRRP